MNNMRGNIPEIRDAMDRLSVEIGRLKRFAEKKAPALYAQIYAAWMGLCLLNDDRLSEKMDSSEDPKIFRHEQSARLLQAVQALQKTCPEDGEICRILAKIRQFLEAHPEVIDGFR